MSAYPLDAEPHGTVSTNDHGNVQVVRLAGQHDISTASEVGTQLDDSIARGSLVVSMAEIEFFDSSIIHALFDADRRLRAEHDRRLVLHVGTPAIVDRVLDVSGLRQRMRCTESLDDAIAMAVLPTESTGGSKQ